MNFDLMLQSRLVKQARMELGSENGELELTVKG